MSAVSFRPVRLCFRRKLRCAEFVDSKFRRRRRRGCIQRMQVLADGEILEQIEKINV